MEPRGTKIYRCRVGPVLESAFQHHAKPGSFRFWAAACRTGPEGVQGQGSHGKIPPGPNCRLLPPVYRNLPTHPGGRPETLLCQRDTAARLHRGDPCARPSRTKRMWRICYLCWRTGTWTLCPSRRNRSRPRDIPPRKPGPRGPARYDRKYTAMKKKRFHYSISGYRWAPESFRAAKGLVGQPARNIPLTNTERGMKWACYL